ncbi:hypothetical protein Tco_0626088 [Tanacetum coccineum]|uniref:Uncharacterized protein n=1 Tax=Tanacetum coccineum TaxID=301880 RepID=A0ABQ4WJD7_9ASTR
MFGERHPAMRQNDNAENPDNEEMVAAVEFWNSILEEENIPFYPYKYKHQNTPFITLRNKPAQQMAHAKFDNILTKKMQQLGCSRHDAIAFIEANLPKPKSYKPIFPAESFNYFPKTRYRDFVVTEEMIQERHEQHMDNLYAFIDASHTNGMQMLQAEREKKARKLRVRRCYTFISCMIFFVALWFLCRYLMYVGDDNGVMTVLKHEDDAELLVMPYHISAKSLTAEAAGSSFPDHQTIVGVLHQPSSSGNRQDTSVGRSFLLYILVLIAYESGLIILWDLFDGQVAVIRASGKGRKAGASINNVVRMQLSFAERKLPVIVLHWSPNSKSQIDYDGQLLLKLPTVGLCQRTLELTLSGSFADMRLIPSTLNNHGADLLVLTSPGHLQLFSHDSLFSLTSEHDKRITLSSLECPAVVPTLHPVLSATKLISLLGSDNASKFLLEIAANMKVNSTQKTTGGKWPVSGGIVQQLSEVDGPNFTFLIPPFKHFNMLTMELKWLLHMNVVVLRCLISGITEHSARTPYNLNSTSLHLVEAHDRTIASVPELNMQLTHMLNELEAEKKRTETLDEASFGGKHQLKN